MVVRILKRLFALVAIGACAGAGYVVAKPLWHKHHTKDATALTTTTTTKTTHHPHTKYTIKKGDTLSEIADRYNVTVDQLKALNPSLVGKSLPVGRRIRLRKSSSSSSSSTK